MSRISTTLSLCLIIGCAIVNTACNGQSAQSEIANAAREAEQADSIKNDSINQANEAALLQAKDDSLKKANQMPTYAQIEKLLFEQKCSAGIKKLREYNEPENPEYPEEPTSFDYFYGKNARVKTGVDFYDFQLIKKGDHAIVFHISGCTDTSYQVFFSNQEDWQEAQRQFLAAKKAGKAEYVEFLFSRDSRTGWYLMEEAH